MGTLFVYIIKSGICLSIFYLFYKLLLSNETFHKFNRAALLGILFLSMILPLIEISFEQNRQVETSENLMFMMQSVMIPADFHPDIEPMPQPETAAITWLHLILLVYIAGVVFVLAGNIYSTIKLCLLIKNSKRKTIENNIVLAMHNNNTAPFSWLKYIVISEKDFNENGNEIIIHEKAHILKRHSIDLLLCQVYNIVQWVNPIAWLFKRELQNIHEYEADEEVINKGIDSKQYKMLLIQKAVGAKLFALANNFKNNKLKKRIKMMSKQKSNPYLRLKYLYVLPLLALVVTAFASTQVKSEMQKISEVSISDFIAQSNIDEYANVADSAAFQTLFGDNDTIFVKNEGSDTDTVIISTFISSIEDTGDTASESYANAKFISKLRNDSILIIVDGKIADSADIDVDNIQSISVFQNGEAIKQYGTKGKNGVMTVVTKKNDNKNGKVITKTIMIKNSDTLKNKAYVFGNEINSNMDFNGDSAYFKILDGKYNKLSFDSVFKYANLDSAWVKNNNFKWNADSFKNKSHFYYYNTDSIKNKSHFYFNKTHLDSLNNNAYSYSFNSDSININYYNWFETNPLVIFDEKEINVADITKIDVTKIAIISILKANEAVKKYGAKARNGAIIMKSIQ
jgi:beta-lactamase regulating signal transducer with metallopeptidase domain